MTQMTLPQQLSELSATDLITLREQLIKDLMSSPKFDETAKQEIKNFLLERMEEIAVSGGLELRFIEP